MMTRRKFLIGTAAGLGVATSMGVTDKVLKAVEHDSPPDVYAELVDVTQSTAAARAEYRDALLAFATAAVNAGAPFYADVWAGEPLASVGWKIHEDYGFPRYHGETQHLLHARREANDALPAKLLPLTQMRATKPGSPLLSALDTAATLRRDDPHRESRGLHLLVATDGIIIGDGIDARNPLPAGTAEHAVARWADRLTGLHGAKLYFSGIGLGSNLDADRAAECEEVVRAVAHAVGAHVVTWGPTLGEAFPRYAPSKS